VNDPSDIEKKIGYAFNEREILSLALTHASAVTAKYDVGNERLEFVGDAVIDLAVARILMDCYPLKDEGWLSQMRSRFVDEEELALKAREIGLGDHLVLGKGEDLGGGRTKPSILANAYEALVGAIFLDGGYEPCEVVIRRQFPEIALIGDDMAPRNFKSILQERLQKEGKALPRYEVIESSGPDHDRMYLIAVFVEGELWGRGSGKNKKEAEMEAARAAVEKMAT
jgi:ribonuclease-3